MSEEAIQHHLRIMLFRREANNYIKEKHAAVWLQLNPVMEPIVEEAAVAEDVRCGGSSGSAR